MSSISWEISGTLRQGNHCTIRFFQATDRLGINCATSAIAAEARSGRLRGVDFAELGGEAVFGSALKMQRFEEDLPTTVHASAFRIYVPGGIIGRLWSGDYRIATICSPED